MTCSLLIRSGRFLNWPLSAPNGNFVPYALSHRSSDRRRHSLFHLLSHSLLVLILLNPYLRQFLNLFHLSLDPLHLIDLRSEQLGFSVPDTYLIERLHHFY